MKRLLSTVLGGFVAVQTAASATAMAANPVINEFMAQPMAVAGVATEWIELYNPDATVADIRGWKINGDDIMSTADVYSIPGYGYYTICAHHEDHEGVSCDAFIHGELADQGMALTITDADGQLVQTFTYPKATAGASTIVEYGEDGRVSKYLNDNNNVYEQDEDNKNTGTPDSSNTLYDQLVTNSSYSTLASVVSSLGLSETLDNPYTSLTVFAPTNAAFAALPAAELQALLANPAQLREIVLGHVASARYDYDALMALTQLQTLTGRASVAHQDGVVMVGGSTVADMFTSTANGQLFSIDKVLLPTDNSVTIEPTTTGTTAPSLNGTVDPKYTTVIIRVNGMTHVASVNGTAWSIPAGVIQINPTGTNVLTAIACDTVACDGDIAMSYSTNAVTYQAPVTIVKAVTTSAPVATATAGGKGSGSVAVTGQSGGNNANTAQNNSSTSETEGESDQSASNDSASDNEQEDSGNAPWYWWVIGIGVLAGLWYVLGRQPNTPTSGK